MTRIAALFCGMLFGAGLALAGMMDPAKVLNFLDVAGTFDPSLAFTMGAAVIVAFLGFRLVRRRAAPLIAPAFHWPTATAIDSRLIGGAAIFGLGWGLAGICPGPAIASLALANPHILAFLVPMAAGMLLANGIAARRPRLAEDGSVR
ncbi:DUF6691 family protein [Roseixanthobacter pseudopolyaromaticivorans]|uniref:DUF6691 family protein n=1 Tax=Xanthobacteraceae TaxID=335928 RepID=UPI003728D90A